MVDTSIFREYDIRGIVDENLTEPLVKRIGLSFAHTLHETHSELSTIIGGDARPSTKPFLRALSAGLVQGGIQVTNIGEVSTPVLYFALQNWNIPNGIVVTGSHNPVAYNGLKITKDFDSFAGPRLQNLAKTATRPRLPMREGGPVGQRMDANAAYCTAVLDQITLHRRLRVVVDSGNGVTGHYVPELYRKLGCEVFPLYTEVDGHFPNHHPDPTRPENLRDLIQSVIHHQADIGIAFDGDGDRVGMVTNQGEIIWNDRLLAFFCSEVLPSHKNPSVVYDVKSSRSLPHTIVKAGGRPVMWKTGHTNIKQKMKSENALLGAEFSGHICFYDRWFGFDDGPYAGARMLEVLSNSSQTMDELFARMEKLPSTPELFIEINEEEKFELVSKMQTQGRFEEGKVNLLDGVRVDYPDGFGLLRASNTSPKLTLRFEGESKRAVERIHAIFARELKRIDSTKAVPELTYA